MSNENKANTPAINKVKEIGLSAHLQSLPSAQAVTVEQLSALIEVVNHNAHNTTKKVNELEAEVRAQKVLNGKLIKIIKTGNSGLEALAKIVDVLDSDLSGVYDDLNTVGKHLDHDCVFSFARKSVAEEAAAEKERQLEAEKLEQLLSLFTSNLFLPSCPSMFGGCTGVPLFDMDLPNPFLPRGTVLADSACVIRTTNA